MSLKTREEVERELRELDAKLNDPKEDVRINRLVLEEIAARVLSPQAQVESNRAFTERFADEVQAEKAASNPYAKPTVRKSASTT